METQQSLWKRIKRHCSPLANLPEGLNWLLSVVEPLVVLGLAFMVAYVACSLVFRSDLLERVRLEDLIKNIGDNWKAGLLLIIVLFYRTIRIFLEEAEEALGVKKRRPVPQPESARELENPSDPLGIRRPPGDPSEKTEAGPEV